MTVRLMLMLCFGTAHCSVSRPIRFHTIAACERHLYMMTAHATKVVRGRIVAQCVAH